MANENDDWLEVSPVPRDPDDDDPHGLNEEWVPQDTPTAPEPDDEEFFQSFDGRWRSKFEGLAYLGHLEAEVSNIPYHHFVVRTLKTGEKIRIIELVQHLEQSLGYARAYRAAVVAAGLVTVDGKPLLVGSRKVDAISQKYQYIIDNWYDYVIDVLYDKINELEGQVLEVLKELGVYDSKREVVEVKTGETAGELDNG